MATEEKMRKITNFYQAHRAMPQEGTLLRLETDL